MPGNSWLPSLRRWGRLWDFGGLGWSCRSSAGEASTFNSSLEKRSVPEPPESKDRTARLPKSKQPVHVCVLGNAGHGKSLLLNALAKNKFLFQAGRSTDSVTQETRSETIWHSVEGTQVEFCLIDTPGLDDRVEEKRKDHTRAVLDGLRNQGHLHLVLIVLSSTEPRFGHAKQALMAQIQKEFGSTFWDFAGVVLTRHESLQYPQEEKSNRDNIANMWRKTICEINPEAKHAVLPFFFIDSEAALRTVEEIQQKKAEGGAESEGDAVKWERLRLTYETERANILQCATRRGKAFLTHSLGRPSITGWKLFHHPWTVGEEVVTPKLEVDHAKLGYTSVKISMSPNLQPWLKFDSVTWALRGTVKYFNVHKAWIKVTVTNMANVGPDLSATTDFDFGMCTLEFGEAMRSGYRTAVQQRLRNCSFGSQSAEEELRSRFQAEALDAVRERASREQQHDGLADEQIFLQKIDLDEEVKMAVERSLNEQLVASTPWGCVELHLRHHFSRYAQGAVALLCIGAMVALLGWQVNLHSCTPSHCKSESLTVHSHAPVCGFLGYPACSEERCCVEKRCSCKNGVAVEGQACYRHFDTGDWCESCEPGYDLMLGACQQPWTCQHGKAQAGARTSDEDRCTSCLEGFHLTEQKTCEMDRPWHCLNGEAVDGYRTSNAQKCRSCNTGFHLTGQQSCEVDRPWLCEHGMPPPGQRSSEEQKCESCEEGYHLRQVWEGFLLVGQVCEQDCSCRNGRGLAKCEPPGSNSCTSCDSGFSMFNGRCEEEDFVLTEQATAEKEAKDWWFKIIVVIIGLAVLCVLCGGCALLFAAMGKI